MRRIYLLLGALALCVPAHAAMISGTATFEVTDGDGVPIGASGFFVLERSVVRDFELTVNGVTFDEFDIHRQCQCFPDSPVLAFAFHYTGPKGHWSLAFDEPHDNFGAGFDVGDFQFFGTLHSGTAGAIFEHNLVAFVAEPGTLPLFALGLFGLARASLRSTSRIRLRRPGARR